MLTEPELEGQINSQNSQGEQPNLSSTRLRSKFRFILSGLVSASLLVLFYLIFVHGVVINYSYLGPDAEYPDKWANILLFGSVIFVLSGLMTLYFTFFEFHKDDDERLRFSNPDSFLLRFVLKDKLVKPISSCSLFWHVAEYALYLFAIVSMPIYLASIVAYIRNEGLSLYSLVALGIYVWLTTMILDKFFGKSKLISRLSSNSWLQRMGFVFLAVILIMAIISNPMNLIYMLFAFLVMAVIVFVNLWLSGKSSNNSLFRNHLTSKEEGHCPIIYPKDNTNNDTEQAVR